MIFALAAITATLFGATNFNDMPAELKKVPAAQLIKLDGTNFSLYKNGKKIKDADSSSPICMSWIPGKGSKFHVPFGVGIYDNATRKGVVGVQIKKVAQNEKFNWYKVGTGVIGKNSLAYLTDWHISIPLKKFYKEGASNKYELWISLKLQGPAYVKTSKKPNAFILDRAILIKK